MALDILEEKGIPLAKQEFDWRDLVRAPISKLNDDAFTRVRVILMNGIEVTAHVAAAEPDPHQAQAYRFGMLEDFDHLYRFTALLDRLKGKDANNILQNYTDIRPGCPIRSASRATAGSSARCSPRRRTCGPRAPRSRPGSRRARRRSRTAPGSTLRAPRPSAWPPGFAGPRGRSSGRKSWPPALVRRRAAKEEEGMKKTAETGMNRTGMATAFREALAEEDVHLDTIRDWWMGLNLQEADAKTGAA